MRQAQEALEDIDFFPFRIPAPRDRIRRLEIHQ